MNNAVSMHLFREGEPKTPELGQKRYEELKKNLEGRGFVEHEPFENWDDVITINYPNHIGMAFITFRSCCYNLNAHGPLLDYNPPLLLAIAGQRPEGGVKEGQYWTNELSNKVYRVMSVKEPKVWVEPIDSSEPMFYFLRSEFGINLHIATIEELMTVFPPTENAQVEPEPRKIKKGDRLLCVDKKHFFHIRTGIQYEAEWDEKDDKVQVIHDMGNLGAYNVDCFTIANEEDPVKIHKGDRLLCVDDSDADLITKGHYYPALTNERDDKPNICIVNDEGELDWFLAKRFTIVGEEDEERDWKESTKIDYNGCRVFIDKTGIYLDCHNGDMSELIRYALQRHDQLKQQ